MAENEKSSEPATPATPADGAPPVPPRRSPGHRGADVKDTVAEMAAKAHEISLEAGSKMAAAMKDVVNAAAGLSGFVIESARDLVQYMVRRGQMTQEEADKLIRQVEEHQPKRKPAPAAASPAVKTAGSNGSSDHHARPLHAAPAAKKPAAKTAKTSKPAAKAASRSSAKPAAKKSKPAPRAAAKKTAPKKAAPKKPAAKKSAAKARRR